MLNLASLWKHHPGSGSRPCVFENQCAVRMGIALGKSGVNMNRYTGVKCWHGHTPAHAIRAEEMGNWMIKNPTIFGPVQKHKKVTDADFKGKPGIIVLINFWGTGNQGDHVDIWNGLEMKAGSNSYFGLAEQVWFWELK